MVKNPPANAGDMRHRFDPWVGKIPWRRKSNPLQYSCLENPTDRRAWWAAVHGVTKSQTQLKQLNAHTHTHAHPHAHMHTRTCTHTHTHTYTVFLRGQLSAELTPSQKSGVHAFLPKAARGRGRDTMTSTHRLYI